MRLKLGLKSQRHTTMIVLSAAVAVLLVLSGSVSADFIGYNITSKTASDDGLTTVILEGLPLAVEVVTGYYVNMAAANCPIKLQIWRRNSYLKYILLHERNFTSKATGYISIPLNASEEFLITTADKLGFSSLSPDSSCVAYTEVPASGNGSETLRYSYKRGTSPLLESEYTFDSYKDNFLYGVGLKVKYGISESQSFVVAGETKVLGYNVTEGRHARIGRLTMLLEGLRLTHGKVTGFHVRVVLSDCPIKLQIWQPITGTYYRLLGETDFTAPEEGYFFVPASTPISISASDKVGFTTLHEYRTCVPYEFVSGDRRSQTLFHGFSDQPSPVVGPVYDFTAFQTTFLFSVEVIVEEVVLLLPGPRGEAGATGPVGDVGEQGPEGEDGEQGPQGLTGDSGRQGEEGEPGKEGPEGPNGITGPPGKAGPQGPEGSQGSKGEEGPVGDPGSKGPQGQTGDPGRKGPDGSIGPDGDQGPPGKVGESPWGEAGKEGPEGGEGQTGAQGATGKTGTAGQVGETGLKGPDGEPGLPGDMWTPMDLCRPPHNISCDHDCESDGITATCTCRKGFKLVDRHKCIDTNECDVKNGLCQYDCANTAGSYKCACPPGLLLSLDNHRCNDIDECADTPNPCSRDQLCINTWGDFYCAGPWPDEEESSMVGYLTSSIGSFPLVTRHVMIGLVLWLVLLSLLMLMAVILLISELNSYTEKPTQLRGTRAEFFYPTFLPRVNLDRRPSADKIEMLDPVTPRRMSRDEANVAQEEMFAHVNRGADIHADTERKRSDL